MGRGVGVGGGEGAVKGGGTKVCNHILTHLNRVDSSTMSLDRYISNRKDV